MIENPAQQVQMQKGEQASSWASSGASVWAVPAITAFSLAADGASAQGMALEVTTRTANKKVMICFTGTKVVSDD